VAYGDVNGWRWKIGAVRIGRVWETTGGRMVDVTDWSVGEVSDENFGRLWWIKMCEEVACGSTGDGRRLLPLRDCGR
jgi:hypothetical protein